MGIYCLLSFYQFSLSKGDYATYDKIPVPKEFLKVKAEKSIVIMVTGKERFKYAEQGFPQDFALVVTFSYGSRDNIELYSKLHDNVRIKDR